jgi:hypothetical protein
VLLYAVMNRGLPLATDLPRLGLDKRPGWAVSLNPAGALTLTWPHVQPLLLNAPVDLSTGWREAAAERGLVLLFVGNQLGLRDHTEGHPTNPGQRATQAAERGELAAGAIAYPGPRQQLEPRPARQTDPRPSSRAARWTRTRRWHLRPTFSTAHPLPSHDSWLQVRSLVQTHTIRSEDQVRDVALTDVPHHVIRSPRLSQDAAADPGHYNQKVLSISHSTPRPSGE